MNIYPAMKFKFGNWEAYQIVMPVEELNRNVVFARDNTKGDTLGEARQREIDESRAKGQIARYLIKPDNERFFNSLVIAVEGGSPSWEPAPIDTADDHIVFDENFKEIERLNLKYSETVLITSAYHMKRSMMIAKNLNLNFKPYSSDFKSISQKNLLNKFQAFDLVRNLTKFNLFFREILGIIAFKIST